MEKLILHPTDISQWYALVNEAEVVRSCHLTEDLESYLVFLLMRFVSQPKLASNTLAIDYFNATKEVGENRYHSLRDLGDKSLLFSGLFPEMAIKKLVDINYFVNLGQSAYGTLSTSCEQNTAQLFAALCEDFLLLTNVLQSVRELPEHKLMTVLNT